MIELAQSFLVIDPGKKAGYAFFFEGKRIRSGNCGGDFDENWGEINDIVRGELIDLVIVESQFISKGKKEGLQTLIGRRFIWEFFGKLSGSKIANIDPASWQSFWNLVPDKTVPKGYKRRKDFKLKILNLARKIFKDNSIKPDEADACLMGAYWTETFQNYDTFSNVVKT